MVVLEVVILAMVETLAVIRAATQVVAEALTQVEGLTRLQARAKELEVQEMVMVLAKELVKD